MDKEEIRARVEEIMMDIEECKSEDIEEAIMESLSEDHHQLRALREKRKQEINELKKRLERERERIQEKERELEWKKSQIKRLEEEKNLEELPEVEDMDLEEHDFAVDEEREKVANKFEFLAEKIKENKYLTQETLEAFDYYRKKLIERSLKEEDIGERLNNLSG